MKTIYKSLLLMSVCSSATAPSMAMTEETDSTYHQPLTETNVKLNEVVITGLTGQQKLLTSASPISVVSPKQLEAQPSTNIIDAISRQPGLSQITTGSGISKPVIRGMGYNRVVVVNDGIRQEGQQWGDEHGVEIDAASVHSVEILKGPASLMYGSDALAGVIVFNSAPTLPMGEMEANVMSGYQSNNGLFDYSLNFAGNKQGFVWNSRYSGKMAHAYKNRYDGYVYGSAYREQSFTQMLGWNHNSGHTHLTLDYYHFTPGIVEGERDEETGNLEVPDGFNPKSYGRSLPFQQIHHYKAVLDNMWYVGDGNIKMLAAYQQNRRQEFEESRDECGLDLMLHTVNYDLHYTSPMFGAWKVAAGINGMWQQSVNKGSEFLIPDYRLFDYGLFATATCSINNMNLSGGVRYDHRHLHSDGLIEDNEQDNDNRVERFKNFSRGFDGLSGSLGVAYELLPNLNLKANVSWGFRMPNISELASNGEHEGTQRYEIGNTALKPEHGCQLDLGLDYSSKIVSAQLSLFANRISNYIFSTRLVDSNGNHVVTDGSDTYKFTSGDARLMGGEVYVDVHPLERLHIGNSFSYVNAVQLYQPSEAKYLPFTPAPRWLGDVRYEIMCDGRTFNHMYVKLAVDCNLRQNHYYAAGGTETSTPSYTLLNLYVGTDIKSHDRRIASVYASCENITNRAYQNHMSRLKYLDVNKATGRMGVFNMGRNFTVKVVVPINL